MTRTPPTGTVLPMSDKQDSPARIRQARAISEAIRHLAEVRGEPLSETTAHLATELGVNERTLRRYMDNVSRTPGTLLQSLADLTGVRVELFVNPPKPPPPPPPLPPEYVYPIADYLLDQAEAGVAAAARRRR